MKAAALLLLTVSVAISATTAQYIAPSHEYHDHVALGSYLQSVVAEYPDMAHLYTIGRSVEGRELWVIAIAAEAPSSHVTLRPEVKYVGNMHGNEAVSRELLVQFVHYLVTEYGRSDDVTTLLDGSRVHVLVSMNPDGFELAYTEGEMPACEGVFGRYSANGLDLNRNFPDFWTHNNATIEPETRAVMDWLTTEQFILSANLHGGALVANYPYDSNVDGANVYSASQDDDVFRHLSKVYSYSHANMYEGSFCGDTFTDGIVNGAEWYPITGGMQDYNYIYAGCMELTLEVACCKYPHEDELEQFWDDNRQALVNLLHQAFIGVKGVVTDFTGRPIKGANVTVQGRFDHWSKTTEMGEYWKILLPGRYVLEVRTHYASKTMDITIPEDQETSLVVNIEFDEDDGPLPPSAADAMKLSKIWLFCVVVSLRLYM